MSIFVSSGDDGVTNYGCGCNASEPISSANCAYQADSGSDIIADWKPAKSWKGTGYFPSYPATCPYVTAVGATMGVTNVVPNIGEAEQACQVIIVTRFFLVRVITLWMPAL